MNVTSVNMKTIYLDNAASTPLRHEVLEVMIPHLVESYGNPSSIHHKGREANSLLEHARSAIASLLQVKSREILFTGSGSEANNLALRGIAHAHQARGKHILISSIEHPSILHTGEQLAHEGFEVEYIPVDQYGLISIKDTLARIRKDTILISVMLANNEIGTLEPVAQLSQKLKKTYTEKERPLLHTDACQATGQISILPHSLGVDVMTLNSAKIYGPKGVGMLYLREDILIQPLIIGGNQESGKRAGTENVPGIIGFAHALQLSQEEQTAHSAHLTALRTHFIKDLKKKIPQLTLNGHPTLRLPNNIHLSIPYIEGESLVLMLDTYGICASTGSACSSHNLLPSHVLRAIGQPPDSIHGSLRFTLGHTTTKEDLTYTATSLAACVARLQALSPLPIYL